MKGSGLLIVYHSQSGASARLARAAELGAAQELAQVERRRAEDTGSREVLEARGLMLVCAENSGRLAGGAKDFLDRIFYPLQTRGCLRSYALLVSAGNDGRGAVAEAQRVFRGIPFTEALEALIIRGDPEDPALQEARDHGAGFAAGLAMGIF